MSLQCPVGKRLFVVAAIATMSLLLGGLACGQEGKPPANEEDQPSIWMKKKLDYSQNILAGLANADFNQITENAQAMQGLSKLEWFIRGRTPGYRTQLAIFQDANAEIIKQAKQDNLEGASLAFTQLTISCVNCHKHLRASKPK